MADRPIDQMLQQYIAKHGPLQGEPYVVNPTTVAVPGVPESAQPTQDPFYRYTFADGSTLEANAAGQIKNLTEKAPKAPTNVQTYTAPDGTLYERQPDGTWKTAAGTPPGTKNAKPSDPATWKPIKDPSGRTIAMQDPVTGDRVAVPQSAEDKNAAQGTTKDTLENGRKITWVADGKGNWSIQTIGDKLDAEAKPKEGDTRQNVKDGYAIQEKYVGGQWVVDPSVPPKPYSPDTQGKAKEGDTRPNVVDGYTIQQVYKGGQWVVDPSVPPKPFVPEKPTTLPSTTDSPFIVQQMPDGSIRQIDDPRYQPKDVAGRTQQLQARAQAKRDDLQKRLDAGDITPERAQQEFDAFWNTQIEPAKQQLALDQQRQQAKDQIDLENHQRDEISSETTYETGRQNTARQAGRDAVSDALALLPYRVGPGYSKAVGAVLNSYSTGKMPDLSQIGADAFTFQAPDLHAISEQATAQALAHLSPYAALKAGAPIPQVPQGVDVNTALNQTTYRPTVSVKPDGTVTVQHAPVAADPSPQAAPAPDPGAVVQQAANAANSIAGIVGGGPDLIRGGDPSSDPNAYLRQLAGYS